MFVQECRGIGYDRSGSGRWLRGRLVVCKLNKHMYDNSRSQEGFPFNTGSASFVKPSVSFCETVQQSIHLQQFLVLRHNATSHSTACCCCCYAVLHVGFKTSHPLIFLPLEVVCLAPVALAEHQTIHGFAMGRWSGPGRAGAG